MGPVVKFFTIVEMFDELVKEFAQSNRPALMSKVDGDYRSISYTELHNTVEQFGNGLAALGVKQGDHIGLISENRPEWVIADMGMIKLGAVNVPVYPTLTPKQTAFIFDDAKVTLAIVSNQFQLNKVLKIIDEVPSLQKIIVFSDKGVADPDRVFTFTNVLTMGEEFGTRQPEYLKNASACVKPDDLLTIIYTSGTTGNPKGVMLTHKNLASNIEASASCIPFTREDIFLSFLPLCHSYERMAGYYTAMSCGATIAYAENIDTIWQNFLEVRPTVATTVPRLFERMYNRLMKQVSAESAFRRKIFQWSVNVGSEYVSSRKKGSISLFLAMKHDLAEKLVFRKIKERTGGNMKFFFSGGAALVREQGEFFEAVGLRIIEGYGMTEASPVISVNRVDDYKFGTVGKPIPGIEVRIAADGEILVRGLNVMKGYWNHPEATREVIDREGWLHTGDIGMVDADGFLMITDRKKDIFVNSGGKNIAPTHIENLFLQSRFIDQFVLIGDRRMFLSALIVPDFDMLKEYAQRNNLAYHEMEELVKKPEIYGLLEGEIGRIQKDLAAYERIRKFTILSNSLTMENGEVTPTLKVRRKVVEEKYKDIIGKMYEGIH